MYYSTVKPGYNRLVSLQYASFLQENDWMISLFFCAQRTNNQKCIFSALHTCIHIATHELC